MTLTDMFAAFSFYFIPILIGSGLKLLPRVIKSHKYSERDFGESVFFLGSSFILGALALFVGAISIDYFYEGDFIKIYSNLIFILLGLAILTIFLYVLRNKINFNINKLGLSFLVVILALITYSTWRADARTNTTLNWDLYHHQVLANKIKRGEFEIVTSNMSDTFQYDGYSTIFHLLLATPKILFKTDILNYWWFLEFFHLSTTIAISYAVAYFFTNNKHVGVFGMFFGAFIFESTGAYTSLFLIPQNLAATIGALFISYYVFKKDINKHQILRVDLVIISFIVYILLNHLIIGTFCIVFLMAVKVYLTIKSRFNIVKTDAVLAILAVIATIIILLLISRIDLNWINRGEAAFYNFDLATKFKFLHNFYGISLYIFLPLGLFYILRERESKKIILLLFTFAAFALLLGQIPYTFKLYSVGRYFTNAFLALGVWVLIKGQKEGISILNTIMLGFMLFIIFILNTVGFKQTPSYKELATHISENEIKAAEFLKKNYSNNSNVMLVSDPSTMQILEPLAEVNTPGGAYATTDTREVLNKIYLTRENDSITNNLFLIKDLVETTKPTKILLAVSKRLEIWENLSDERKYGIFYNVWAPADLDLQDLAGFGFTDFLTNYTRFNTVFANDTITIFEVSRLEPIF